MAKYGAPTFSKMVAEQSKNNSDGIQTTQQADEEFTHCPSSLVCNRDPNSQLSNN